MTAPRPVITCGACQQNGPKDVNGWCANCARRWRRAGRPADGPPPPMPVTAQRTLAHEAHRAVRLDRVEEFAMVRATRRKPNGDPISIGEAAAAVGVSRRTGQRYAAALNRTGR